MTASAKPSKLGFIGKILILIAAGVLPPLIVIGALADEYAVGLGFLGILVGLIATLSAGTRLALAATFALMLVAPISVVVGEVPIAGAATMALACLGVGVTAGWGLHGGLSIVPIAMSMLMVNPPHPASGAFDRTSTAYLVVVILATGFASLWAAVSMGFLLRQVELPKPARNSRADTVEYAVIITVLCSVSTFFVLTYALNTQAAWLIVTLLVCVQLGAQQTIRMSVERILGTVLGGAVAAIIVMNLHSAAALAILAVVALLLAIAFRLQGRYWLYAVFLTNTIVLSSGPARATAIDEARVGYTLAGGILALAAIGVSQLIRATRADG